MEQAYRAQNAGGVMDDERAEREAGGGGSPPPSLRFTPAPWRVSKERHQFYLMAGTRVVAIVMWPDAEAEATASLIAAAPDLLGALMVVTDTYVRLIEDGDAGNWNADEDEAVMFARAAIRKATEPRP